MKDFKFEGNGRRRYEKEFNRIKEESEREGIPAKKISEQKWRTGRACGNKFIDQLKAHGYCQKEEYKGLDGLPNRPKWAFMNAGIYTKEQFKELYSKYPGSLYKLRNFGKGSMEKAKKWAGIEESEGKPTGTKKKPKMKYMMFGSHECYYAAGGWNDFITQVDTPAQAAEIFKSRNTGKDLWCDDFLEWYHCVNIEAGTIVRASRKTPNSSSGEDAELHPEIYKD